MFLLLLLLLAVPAIAFVTSIIPTLRNAFNFGFVDAATNAVLGSSSLLHDACGSLQDPPDITGQEQTIKTRSIPDFLLCELHLGC